MKKFLNLLFALALLVAAGGMPIACVDIGDESGDEEPIIEIESNGDEDSD